MTTQPLIEKIQAILPTWDYGNRRLWDITPFQPGGFGAGLRLTSTTQNYPYRITPITRYLSVNEHDNTFILTDAGIHLYYLNKTGYTINGYSPLLRQPTKLYHPDTEIDPIHTYHDNDPVFPALKSTGPLDQLPEYLDDMGKMDNRIHFLCSTGLIHRAPISWYLARWNSILQSGTDVSLIIHHDPGTPLKLTVHDITNPPKPMPWINPECGMASGLPLQDQNHTLTDPYTAARHLEKMTHALHHHWDRLRMAGIDLLQLAELKPGQQFTIDRA